MENHTRRIRKARRQGEAPKKDLAAPRSRGGAGRGMRGPDVPGEPRPNARRRGLTTGRKAKRQTRSATRRGSAPRARAN